MILGCESLSPDEFVSPGADELLKVHTLWYVHVTHDLTMICLWILFTLHVVYITDKYLDCSHCHSN